MLVPIRYMLRLYLDDVNIFDVVSRTDLLSLSATDMHGIEIIVIIKQTVL